MKLINTLLTSDRELFVFRVKERIFICFHRPPIRKRDIYTVETSYKGKTEIVSLFRKDFMGNIEDMSGSKVESIPQLIIDDVESERVNIDKYLL